MPTAALETTDTRTRLIDVAIDLFTRHSYAGTSLQMIADELGSPKAAIYHHFRTREQLLAAVIEPMLHELRTVVNRRRRDARRTPARSTCSAATPRWRFGIGARGGARRRPQCGNRAHRAP